MSDLTFTSDVEDAMGRSLTEEEAFRAQSLIALASAHVEVETGYRFAPGDYTVGRKVHGGQVRLPATVASVTEVRDIDPYDGTATVLTGYTVRRGTIYGIYGVHSETQFNLRRHHPFVEVDFTVTAPVPQVVSRLVAGVVAATLLSPPAGAASETAGPFSISYVNSSGKVWLSASDKAILSRYTQPKPAINLLG